MKKKTISSRYDDTEDLKYCDYILGTFFSLQFAL